MYFKSLLSIMLVAGVLSATSVALLQSSSVAAENKETKSTSCKSGYKWDKALKRCVEAGGGY